MSEYNISEAIDRIVDLANKANTNSAVKQVLDLPSGEKGILLNDGSYTVVGTATKDALGNRLEADPRISKALTVQTEDSLVEYVDRFRTEGTTLFANIDTNTIVAVLDYHVNNETRQFGQHVVSLKLPYSEEWKLWKDISGTLMPQLDFARFLEENGCDIIRPAGADLLEAVKDLQSKRKVNFIAAVRTNSDTESFEYSDNTDTVTKDGLEVPTRFVLSLPVYFDARQVEVSAFLRNKVEEGRLHLGIKLSRAEQVRQAMFREIVSNLADRAKAPVIYAPYSS